MVFSTFIQVCKNTSLSQPLNSLILVCKQSTISAPGKHKSSFLAHIPPYNDFEVPLCCYTCQYFVPFGGYRVLSCVHILSGDFPFTSLWTFALFWFGIIISDAAIW